MVSYEPSSMAAPLPSYPWHKNQLHGISHRAGLGALRIRTGKVGGAHPPALLTLQQLAVGSNFHVQGQLDVHERLVVTQQPSQVLLGLIQGSIQVPKFLLSIF